MEEFNEKNSNKHCNGINRNGRQKNHHQDKEFCNEFAGKIDNEEIMYSEISSSDNDRVVNLIKNAFHFDPDVRFASYEKIVKLGRRALSTLYLILSDDETAKIIAAKTLGIKMKDFVKGDIDNNIKYKIDLRAVIIKNVACTCSAKIVKNLDYEEKSKLASIFQKLLDVNLDKDKYSKSILQSYDDLKHNILLSIPSLSDAAASLSATINNILKQNDVSTRVKTQAITAMAYIAELSSRNSANILINIFADKKEQPFIRTNALCALGEIGDSLSIEQVDEIINLLISELEENEDNPDKNKYIEAALEFGKKRINKMIDVIKDTNKKLATREFACYVCFGIARKNPEIYDFIVGSFIEIRDSLKNDSNLIYESDNKSILNLIEEILRMLSY
jgi:hypothetical protein